ncbi:MAG: aldehyde dehydrogenase family protein [Neisseriales bacterium]|nr:MAG: aldehyde dehydrogenase family protein [Neisseriales bacterium]
MTTYISCDPSTGQVIQKRPAQKQSVLSAQVAALRTHQKHWAIKPPKSRAKQLSQLALALDHHRDALSTLITQETGRLLSETRAEIDKSIRLIDYYTATAPKLLASRTVATQATCSQIQFEPLGIVLAIMPWNYPIWQVLRFAVPALLAGNACLIKPALSVAQSTQALLDMIRTIQLDVLEVAWLPDQQVEEAISYAQAVAFTGSTKTGQHIAALAGKYLKKTVLELGGSNPFIILSDANLKEAAQDACLSRFRDAGQSCNAAKRFIVVPEIAEPFIEQFLKLVKPLRCGQTLSPLARCDLRATLHQQVLDAVAQGAALLMGGNIPGGTGFFYPATVLDHVNSRCRVYHEEVFGPVASILRATSEEDAIRLANDTPFGLGVALYTSDMTRAKNYAKCLEAGSVFINRYTSSDLHLPFGGVKSSGYGRELSAFGLYEFVNIKTYWQK